MTARDLDRQVSASARRSLDHTVAFAESPGKLVLRGSLVKSLVSFVQRAVLDPTGLYLYLNPVQISVNVVPQKTVKGRAVPVAPVLKPEGDPESRHTEDESEEDRKARLRVGGLGVFEWLLGERHRCVLLD